MDVNGLIRVLVALSERGSMSMCDVSELAAKRRLAPTNDAETMVELGLVETPNGSRCELAERGQTLLAKARRGEARAFHDAIRGSLDYDKFIKALCDAGRTRRPAGTMRFSNRAKLYAQTAELATICARVRGRLYETTHYPVPFDFAATAVARWEEASGEYTHLDSGLVEVGMWLEKMIVQDAIHPVTARHAMRTCMKDGSLRVTTEGSTPNVKHRRSAVCLLEREEGGSVGVREAQLYTGDFIIEGKASVSLRLAR